MMVACPNGCFTSSCVSSVEPQSLFYMLSRVQCLLQLCSVWLGYIRFVAWYHRFACCNLLWKSSMRPVGYRIALMTQSRPYLDQLNGKPHYSNGWFLIFEWFWGIITPLVFCAAQLVYFSSPFAYQTANPFCTHFQRPLVFSLDFYLQFSSQSRVFSLHIYPFSFLISRLRVMEESSHATDRGTRSRTYWYIPTFVWPL